MKIFFFLFLSFFFSLASQEIVIFGATGDLTARKLIPALYQLKKAGFLKQDTLLTACGRKDFTKKQFIDLLKEKTKFFTEIPSEDVFFDQIQYLKIDFETVSDYEKLKDVQEETLFYLATPPLAFSCIVENLIKKEILQKGNKKKKVIFEKPFGVDLPSAIELQEKISFFLDENQIYRMDHYLGKDSVRAIIPFRLQNIFFESIWNHTYVDHVDIIFSEEIGVGSRGEFFEKTGFLRDVIQNHLLQVLSLFTCDFPETKNLYEEKKKILKSLPKLSEKEAWQSIMSGQYGSGEKVKSYLEEEGVDKNSQIETFVGAKIFLDHERFKGIPFYLLGGKRLEKNFVEVNIFFKAFKEEQNLSVLSYRIQPEGGFSWNQSEIIFFEKSFLDAYAKLIYDCLQGNQTFFVSFDEILASWEFIDPILNAWKKQKYLFIYPAGKRIENLKKEIFE